MGHNLKQTDRFTPTTVYRTDNKNKGYLPLSEITPEWFERLNIILNANDDDDIIHTLYSEINDYKKMHSRRGIWISLVICNKELRRISECTAISGNFSYVLRRLNKHKLDEIVDKFTKHWNEKHRDVFA